MPDLPILDRLERAYEHLLNKLEEAIVYPITVLERYSVRMYRFLRHMLIKTLRLIWLLLSLLLYLLAPAYVGSFGDELMRRGMNWFLKGAGGVVALAGLCGLLLMGWGLVVYFISTRKAQTEDAESADQAKKSKPQRAVTAILIFDSLSVLYVYAAPILFTPGYVFTSWLLKLTQTLLATRF
jgi:hypothetical protein